MSDVLDAVRRADRAPKRGWSETPEGRAVRSRVFTPTAETVPRNRPRRWPALVAAAVVVAMIVASVAVVAALDEEENDVGAPAGSSAWRTVSAAPIADLAQRASVWTGHEVVFVGVRPDGVIGGAAFDPNGSTWRRIADSPMASSAGTGDLVVVRLFHDVVVWRASGNASGSGPTMAAYDPTADTWRELPPAPTSLRAPEFASARSKLVVVDGEVVCPANADCAPRLLAPMAFDIESETWSMVPPPFAGGGPERDVMIGGNGYFVVAIDVSDRGPTFTAVTARFEPLTGTWMTPSAAQRPVVGSGASLGGPAGHLYAFTELSGLVAAFEFDVNANQWDMIRPPPSGLERLSFVASSPGAVAVSDDQRVRVLATRLTKPRLQFFEAVWTRFPAPPSRLGTLLWAGRRLVGVASDNDHLFFTRRLKTS